MHDPIDMIIHTMAFDKPVVEHWLEREIAQWVHPMKDRSDDPYRIYGPKRSKSSIIYIYIYNNNAVS